MAAAAMEVWTMVPVMMAAVAFGMWRVYDAIRD
jgi:hypothetical protein